MICAKSLKTEYMTDPVGIDSRKQRLSWKVQGAKQQTAYQIRLSVNEGGWRQQEPVRSDRMHAALKLSLASRDRVCWQVRLTDEKGETGPWSESAAFEMGLLEQSDWEAKWIMGDYDHDPDPKVRYPVDCFHKEIPLGEKLIRARLYATACGIYEACIDGERVGDQVMAPGSTAFQKRVHYQTYDVTGYLLGKERAELTFWLADGYYASRQGVFGKAKPYGSEPKLLAQLELYYKDGTKKIVGTDKTFSWSDDGPIRMADMKDGEVVDLCRHPSYSGSARETVYEGIVCASDNVPVREKERFSYPRVIRCPDGHTVLDFGQNLAGYMEVALQGAPGHKCSMVFGERLDENGNFSYTNISYEGEYDKCHFQTNDVICDGKRHIYKPRFTVMGFQYVLLLEWPEEILPQNFTAIAVYSDMDVTFDFMSSDPGLDRIVKNTFWSVKGNFLDVPTDCPTRERAGWTGDAQLFFNTGNYMMDQRSFFRKWLRDVADCQKENGLVYNVNPSNPSGSALLEWVSVEGSAGWGDAMIMIPYYYWKRYGDDVLIREFWGPMKKCFSFYKRRMGKRNLLSVFSPKHSRYNRYLCACGRDFGEWTEPDDCAPPKAKMMIPMAEEATGYLSYTAGLMAEMAEHLGKKELAEHCRGIQEKTKETYNFYFVQGGNITSERMCKYVRPCGLGLAKGEARRRLLEKIVDLNRKRDYRIGTGFLSTPFVLELLSEAGESGDAYRMLMNPDLGWMQQVNQGATTVWENWTPDASLNHYSKGACCQWIFDCLCGVKLDGRENTFVIEPHTVPQLERISFSYDSVYGTVKSGWEKTEVGYVYSITVPDNCRAEVRLPGDGPKEVRVLEAGEYVLRQGAHVEDTGLRSGEDLCEETVSTGEKAGGVSR